MSLGNLLLKEFSSGPYVDTISRWMVFYIAEQIKLSNKSNGKKKIEAEKRCFDMILKLWKHRSYYPNSNRPFEKFDIIFKVLERLDPDNKRPYYFSDNLLSDPPKYRSEELTQWLNLALGIDEAVRVWMEFIFNQATKGITDSKSIEWLKYSNLIFDEMDDTTIINIILEDDIISGNSSNKDLVKEKQKLLKSRISKLKKYVKFNKDLLILFQQELNNPGKEDIKDITVEGVL